MAGRLIGKGSANSSTVASPSASRRTIERRVGSDNAAKTTSNRSEAVTVIVAVPPTRTSQTSYLTEHLNEVKDARRVNAAHRSEDRQTWAWMNHAVYSSRYAAAAQDPDNDHLTFVRVTTVIDADRPIASVRRAGP